MRGVGTQADKEHVLREQTCCDYDTTFAIKSACYASWPAFRAPNPVFVAIIVPGQAVASTAQNRVSTIQTSIVTVVGLQRAVASEDKQESAYSEADAAVISKLYMI